MDNVVEKNNQENKQSNLDYIRLISANKIFSSKIDGFKDYAPFDDIDFQISRFSLVDGPKFSDSMISAKDVKIHIHPGIYCPMIISRLSRRTVVKKIKLAKIKTLNGKKVPFEEFEFNECTFQDYHEYDDKIMFSFRYISFSYTNTLYTDGTKDGSSGVSVDLAKWDIKES